MKATVNLARAQGGKDLKLLKVALPQAEQAINRFSADVMRFLSEFTGSAGTVATVLQVTSAASFAIVRALAVPVVITPGATAAGATVIVGGGVSVLQSAANELGNAASGQKVDLWQSVKTGALDGAIGVATAGIASKIPLGFVEKMSKGLATKLVSEVPGLTAAQLQPFISKFFQGTGEETIKAAVGEAIGVVGKVAKTGKAPTEKDFEEAVQKVLMTAMTAGFMKNIASFQKKWAFDSRNAVEKTLIPSVLKDFLKGKKVPPVAMAKLQVEVWNKVSDEVTKGGITIALEVTKGTDDPDKLSKAAEAGILKHARTQKLIEKQVEKFLKKEKML